MTDFKSVEEAAKYLGISGSAVRKAIQEGRLSALRVGGVHIVSSKALSKYKVNPMMQKIGKIRARKAKKK